MDTSSQQDSLEAVLDLQAPVAQRVPLVFSSPHSGSHYPDDFLAQSALDPLTLRKSEDSHVDELFRSAPEQGAPLLRALLPRAYVDPNREPYELDPAMFDGPLPDYANTDSPRVNAGLGTIARVVASGAEIYRHRLPVAEALYRIDTVYRPYHAALRQLVEATHDRFGCVLLVDCHSMPSVGGPTDRDAGTSRVDMVLGDCYGRSCTPLVMTQADRFLSELGYRVVRNTPYAGGFTTRHYGDPADGRHTLQIEINRRLYMNETTHGKLPEFARLQHHMSLLIAHLASLSVGDLRP